MKTPNLISKTCAVFSLLIGATLFTQSASAYTVYQLEQDYYAIVCQDGQIFSYSGGAGGIGIVAPSLCEGHGGIAGGNGGGVDVAAAPAELKRAANSCKGGKQVARNTHSCRTKIRVNRWETAVKNNAEADTATQSDDPCGPGVWARGNAENDTCPKAKAEARSTMAAPATSHNASRSNRSQGVTQPDVSDNHNSSRSNRTEPTE